MDKKEKNKLRVKFSLSKQGIFSKFSFNYFKALILGLVILLACAGFALAFHFWNPLWNPFTLSPDSVIGRMVDKMVSLKTYHSDFKVNLNLNGSNPSSVSMELNGDSDVSSPQEPKLSSDLYFKLDEIRTGDSLEMKAKTIVISDNAYFKLEELNLPASLNLYMDMAGINKNKIIGKWIKENREAPSGLGKKKLSQEEKNELEKKIKDIFRKEKIYKIEKILPAEKINNEETYHYLLSLDKDGLKKILPDLLKVAKSYYPKDKTSGIYDSLFQGENLNKAIDKFFEKTGGLKAEIWIGRRNFYLLKLKIEKKINMANFSDELEGNTLINLIVSISKFNEKLTIKAPAKFIKEKDFLNSFKRK